MKQQPRIFVLCGVHNHLTYTKKFLQCLYKQSYPKMEIVIVDDGSTDGTQEYLQSQDKKIQVIRGKGNLWWTGCMYVGVKEILKKAKARDFILTINNDCTFSPKYVDTIVQASLNYRRAIMGSLILDCDHKSTIIDAGVGINWLIGAIYPLGPYKLSELPPDAVVQDAADTLPTKGTLIPIEVFNKVGNFDRKHLPHYLSDYEFICRAKRAGFSVLVSYNARLYTDIYNTGIGGVLPDTLTYPDFFRRLFSKRSKVNIIDQMQFVRLICPPNYRPINYLFIGHKLILYLLHLPPFNIVVYLIIGFKKLIGKENVYLSALIINFLTEKLRHRKPQ